MFSLVATLAKCLLPRRAGVCLQSANHQNQSSLRCRLQKPLCSSMRHFVFEVGVHPHQASAHRKNSMTHLQLQVCNRAHSTVNTIGDLRSGISSNTNSTFRVTRGPQDPPRHVLAAAVLCPILLSLSLATSSWTKRQFRRAVRLAANDAIGIRNQRAPAFSRRGWAGSPAQSARHRREARQVLWPEVGTGAPEARGGRKRIPFCYLVTNLGRTNPI